MSIIIDKINLKNYRSCKRVSLPLHHNLSALIGVNGSGKSNILKSILLLKKTAKSHGVGRKHHDDAPLSNSGLTIEFIIDGNQVRYESLVKYYTNEINVDSVVDATGAWTFYNESKIFHKFTFPLSWATEGHFPWNQMQLFDVVDDKETYIIKDLFRHIIGKESDLPSNKQLRPLLKQITKVSQFASNIKYYSASQFTDPSRCPNSFELENGKLTNIHLQSANVHLQFLYDLYLTYKDERAKFLEFSSVVGREGIGLVESIEFAVIPIPSSSYKVNIGGTYTQKEVKKELVIPQLNIRGDKLSPNQLSEGTFKTLATIFYIMTDQSPLLLLEEPEVCVHHGLLSSVIEILKTFSKNKQIIISTHSDYVLDALSPENVLIVKNDSKVGTYVKTIDSSMSNSERKALKDYLANVGNLGEFWRSGGLD